MYCWSCLTTTAQRTSARMATQTSKHPTSTPLPKRGCFSSALTLPPQCVPSRASIMTGRSPIAVQMTRFSNALAAEYKIFPEILREKGGYYSGVAGRTYHLDGSAQPPETRQVFEKHGLQTFAKRLDFVKTAGT